MPIILWIFCVTLPTTARGLACARGPSADTIQLSCTIQDPALALHTLIAWTAIELRQDSRWVEFIDRQTIDPSSTGDDRARWLLARAALEALRQHDPLAGKAYINRAIASAQSQHTSAACFAHLSYCYMRAGMHQQALSVLASTVYGFSDAKAKARVQVTQQLITADERAAAAEARRHAGAIEVRRLEGELLHLRERAAAAQRAGKSPEDIQSLQRMIKRTQNELALRRSGHER